MDLFGDVQPFLEETGVSPAIVQFIRAGRNAYLSIMVSKSHLLETLL